MTLREEIESTIDKLTKEYIPHTQRWVLRDQIINLIISNLKPLDGEELMQIVSKWDTHAETEDDLNYYISQATIDKVVGKLKEE